jgi:hypothetical protein
MNIENNLKFNFRLKMLVDPPKSDYFISFDAFLTGHKQEAGQRAK